MDVNNIALGIVCASTVMSVVEWARSSRRADIGWLVVASIDVGVVGLGLALAPNYAGYMAIGVWTLLFVLPTILRVPTYRMVAQQKYLGAVWAAGVMALLHPSKAWRNQLATIRALALTSSGRARDASRLMEHVTDEDSWVGRLARINLLLAENRWPEIIAFVQLHPRRRRVLSDDFVFLIYVRAIADAGRTRDVVEAYLDASTDENQRIDVAMRVARFFFAVYTGRFATVERLLSDSVLSFGRTERDFWRATALQAVGRCEEATVLLRSILDDPDALLAEAARCRLEAPVQPIETVELSAEYRARLSEIEDGLVAIDRIGAPAPPKERLALVTYALLGLLATAFVVEIPGGTTNSANLVRLGALVGPSEYLDGQYWRVFTAELLHAGGLHLAFNLLGIWYFGRFLERAIGWHRFLLVYVVSGVCAYTTIMVWTIAFGSQPYALVGASGSLMGIVGAWAAVLLRRWLRTRAPLAREELWALSLIILLQSAIDLSTPQVSFAAHAIGVVTGLVLGWLVSGESALEHA